MPYRVVLPRPTGPYAIGTTEVRLKDARRELLVTVWYPTRAARRQFRAKPCGRHPVLLYSPGPGVSRVFGTHQVEDLASLGYVVVTIPWDDPGAVKKATETRSEDVRFVLDSLPRLPRRLRHGMDLNRIGMLGDNPRMRLTAPRAVTVR